MERGSKETKLVILGNLLETSFARKLFFSRLELGDESLVPKSKKLIGDHGLCFGGKCLGKISYLR